MIVILKREDLLPEYFQHPAEDLQLSHFKLSEGAVEEASLIVFLEGSKVKYLKHLAGFQTLEDFDIFMSFVTSTPPVTKLYPKKKRRPRRPGPTKDG